VPPAQTNRSLRKGDPHAMPDSTPPPSHPRPTYVPAYALPETVPPRTGFAYQAARATVAIHVLFLGCLIRGQAGEQFGSQVTFIFGCTNIALIVAGFVLAIIALTKSNGRKDGTVSSAALGLIANSIFLAAIGYAFFTAAQHRRQAAFVTAARANAQAQAIAQGQQSFTAYDGWLGVARPNGAPVVLAELSDDSSMCRQLSNDFTLKASLASLSINNSSGSPMQIDPDSLVITLADQTIIRPLRTADFLASAKYHADQWQARFATPWTVPPGSRKDDGLIILPHGTSLHTASTASVLVNGKWIAMSGRVYTSAEKTRLAKSQQTKQ
jgi:hypothetical protein